MFARWQVVRLPGGATRRRRPAPSGRGRTRRSSPCGRPPACPCGAPFSSDSGTGFLYRASTAPPSRSMRSRVTKILPWSPSKVMPFSVSSRMSMTTPLAKMARTMELGGGVVAVVDGRIAALELDREHALDDLDRCRARVLHADGPLADVDVVGAPVGHLAAGVLVPPAEVAVAAMLAIVDLRRLAQPHVPVQLGGRLDRGERAAGRRRRRWPR